MRQCCVSFGGFVSCLFLFLLLWLLVRFLLRLLVLLLSLVRCVVWRLLLVLLGSACARRFAPFLAGALSCTFLPVLLLLVLPLLLLVCCLVVVSPLAFLPLWCLVVRFCPCVGSVSCGACFLLPLFVCSCWLVSVGGSSAFFESASALLKSVNVKKYD